MAVNKLMLESYEDEAFFLCGIHSTLAIYKVAFLLNKHLNLKLERHIKDIKVKQKTTIGVYPCYAFDDINNYNYYALFKNKCLIESEKEMDVVNNLFGHTNSKMLTKNLIPEFKKVDYFLKIETESQLFDLKKIISNISSIKQVITAFAINYDKIKTKNNLIIT